MTKIDSLLLLSLGELLVVTTLLSILMIAFAVIRRRRDRCAALRLITRIKDGEAKRSAETENIVQHKYGMAGRALEGLVKNINRQEKIFYQRLINLYLKRDADALATLHIAFEGATEPYRSLELTQGTGVTVPPEDEDQSAELKRLQEENGRLSQELAISMDTLGRMLSEYSSMYAGGTGEELDKEKMLEMFRAEAIAAATGPDQSPAEPAVTAGESGTEETVGEVERSSGDSTALDDTVEFESVQQLPEESGEAWATEVAESPTAEGEGDAAEQELATAVQTELGIDYDTLDELMSLEDGLEGAPEEGGPPESGAVEDSQAPARTQG